jgi:capsular polysaccharide biosynthesis protein
MVYDLKHISSNEDFDFILENIEDYNQYLGDDLEIGWYEEKRWRPKLQWQMPDGYKFQNKKVGVIVAKNPTVIRYEKRPFRIIVDKKRKIYFGGEILGLPNSSLPMIQSGPKRSIKIPDVYDPSKSYCSKRSDAPWVLLEAPGYRCWGHWIVDHVPRLYLLYKLGLINSAKFVFFEDPPKWTRIFFEVFSISKDRIVVINKTCFYADHLIIPAFFREQNRLFVEYTAEAWDFLKQKLLEKKSKENFISTFFSRDLYKKKIQKMIGKKNLRVYISRRKSKIALANENALEQLLLRYGFFTFFPEDIDLPTCAAFLQHAEIVVGEDGSGMQNVIFCRRSCTVIDINSRFRPKIGQLRENEFQRVINANLFERSWNYTPSHESGAVFLNIDDFERFLNNIIDRS